MIKRKRLAVIAVVLVGAAVGTTYAFAGGTSRPRATSFNVPSFKAPAQFNPRDVQIPSQPQKISVPVKGKDTPPCKGLYALVNNDGSLAASCGVTQVAVYEPGFLYAVAFSQKVTKCCPQVSVGLNNGFGGPLLAFPSTSSIPDWGTRP